MRPVLFEILCDCGKKFQSGNRHAELCSVKCRKARKRRQTRKRENNKEYYDRPQNTHGVLKNNCADCGTPCALKFCSSTCAMRVHQRRNRARRYMPLVFGFRLCPECGDVIRYTGKHGDGRKSDAEFCSNEHREMFERRARSANKLSPEARSENTRQARQRMWGDPERADRARIALKKSWADPKKRAHRMKLNRKRRAEDGGSWRLRMVAAHAQRKASGIEPNCRLVAGKTHHCKLCDAAFVTKSGGQKFCSDEHRVYYYNRRVYRWLKNTP